MNPVAPVEPAAAWTTAWPAGLALVALLAALWLCRRDLWPARGQWLPLAGLALLALAVRLLWIPALTRHEYDGHEADYLDFFLGLREPTRGGTVLYPAMQWFYFLSGKLLSGRIWPVLMAAGASLVSIGAAMAVARRLFGSRAAWWTGLFLVLYGNHAFWSSSAYNVMIPLALSLVCLWGMTRAAQDGALRFTLLGGAAGVLALACRLESALLVVPVAGLLLWKRARPLWRHCGLLALAVALATCAALPLVHPGGMPGEGERALCFPINLGLLAYSEPWAAFWALPLVLVALLPAPGGAAPRRAPALILLAWALAITRWLASFDDYGYRHALATGVALAMLYGGALQAWSRWPALAVGGALLLGNLWSLQEVARLYYAPEESFAASLPPELPRLALAERGVCTLVAEDPRVVGDPPLSHFNLLDPAETARLRSAGGGCLQYCTDLQDWRWSSRGVRDRAIRIERLYQLRALAVLSEPDSGYACLLHEVGARRTGVELWLAGWRFVDAGARNGEP